MYNPQSLPQNYNSKIAESSRDIRVKLYFVNRLENQEHIEFGGDIVQNFKVTESVNADGEQITMGSFCVNQCEINLIRPPRNISYLNACVIPYMGVVTTQADPTAEPPIQEEIGWVELGKFWVTDTETDNNYKTLSLTAYSVPESIENIAENLPSGSASLTSIMSAVATNLTSIGITLNQMPDRVTQEHLAMTVDDFGAEGLTIRQAVSTLAGLLGCNARCERDGSISFVWYSPTTDHISAETEFANEITSISNHNATASSDMVITQIGGDNYQINLVNGQGEADINVPRNLQYLGGASESSENVLQVTGFVSGTTDNPIAVGTGAVGVEVNFENKYMTEEIAQEIYAEKIYDGSNYFAFMPCNIKWRGDPRVQPSDSVSFDTIDADGNELTFTSYVMNHEMVVGGGFNDTIECNGENEKKASFSSDYHSVSVAIPNQILSSIEKITGNTGGYVMLHDSNGDGYPDEILITDSQDITTATSIWRWNERGLMYASSYNGEFATLAIDTQGHINGRTIESGSLEVGALADSTLNRIDEGLNEYQRMVAQYMTFGSDNGLIIGGVNSPFKTQFTNTQVSFLQEANVIAYINGNKFYINNGEILESLKVANFAFKPRANGNLSIVKII